MNKNRISFAQLQEENELLHLCFDAGPNVDLERIELNSRRLAWVKWWAGIGSLVLDRYSGEVSETIVDAGAGGVNPDGSATLSGGKALRKEANRSQSSLIYPPGGYYHPRMRLYNKLPARLSINRNEAASRVADKVQAGNTSESAWAAEFDNLIRTDMRRIAVQSVLKDDFSGYITAGTSLMFWKYLPAAAVVLHGMTWILEKREGENFKERRFSLFPFVVQPDRFALAVLGTLIPGMVQVRQ